MAGLRLLLLFLTSAACSSHAGNGSAPPPASAAASEPIVSVASMEGLPRHAPQEARGFPSVVIFEPFPDSRSSEREQPIIDQFNLQFIPRVTIVQAGTEIEFRNSEDVAHNVHVSDVASAETLFNIATMPGFPQRVAIDRPGYHVVLCDVHPTMEAYIVALSPQQIAILAERDGSFVPPLMPPGEYTMRIWSVNPDLRSERLVRVAVSDP